MWDVGCGVSDDACFVCGEVIRAGMHCCVCMAWYHGIWLAALRVGRAPESTGRTMILVLDSAPRVEGYSHKFWGFRWVQKYLGSRLEGVLALMLKLEGFWCSLIGQ